MFIGCVSVIENVESAGRLQPALLHGVAVAWWFAWLRSGEDNLLIVYACYAKFIVP